jgi:hypothetical protein
MRVWLAVASTLICTAVFGHGSEQWINDAKLVDPVSKALCCGPSDCTALAVGSVERVLGGYKVNTCSSNGITRCHSHPMATTISVSATTNRSYRMSGASSCRRMRYDRQGHIELRCTDCEPPPQRTAMMFVSCASLPRRGVHY